MVSIHAPTRGATFGTCYKSPIIRRVSIHAPTRGATVRYRRNLLFGDVSIHAPTRGATIRIHFFENILAFQSTHPHGVRLPVTSLDNRSLRFQSTHPHGVRRYLRAGLQPYRRVSIHAPTRGATHSRLLSLSSSGCFNPRTHTGCDITSGSYIFARRVSIHAPTRGATNWLLGVRLADEVFQSTHPHGVRRVYCSFLLFSSSFNPRTHTGCDNKRYAVD